MLYKAVVQSVLLYGCESWTITDSMRKVLEGFHHRIARRIAGKVAFRQGDEWVWPPLEEALDEAGLWPMREYIRRRQATVEQYIATRPIYGLCTTAVPQRGSSRLLRWWQQHHSAAEGDDDGGGDDGGDDDGGGGGGNI